MATIRPFAGRLIEDDWATEVPSPAHDSMTGQQRRSHVERHHATYLRVERAIGDGVTDTDDAREVLAEGRAALDELLQLGAFGEAHEAMFLYRLEKDGHQQTGIVAELAAADIALGLVRPHEDVSRDRAAHLAAHFEHVGAQSSPMLLGVRGRGELEDLIERAAAGMPHRVVDAGDGVRQSIWVVEDPAAIAALVDAVAGEPLYVVDGHHRVAATTLHSGQHPDRDDAQWTLAVLYPTSELRVYEYNRLIASFGDLATSEVLDRLRALGPVEPIVLRGPPGPGTLHVFLDDQWFECTLGRPATDDVVARLDPTRLQDEVLPAVFGIEPDDPDGAVAHIGPNTAPEELAEQARRLGGAAIVLHPLEIDDVLAVADAGRHLPRKSTYFAPKARSGVFLREMGDR